MQTLALIGPIGTWEMIVLLVLGLLIFGRRLPEVGRGLGKSIVEFRKGLQGIEKEVDEAVNRPPQQQQFPPRDQVGAAKPPLNSAGEDARVSRSDSVEQDHVDSAR
jgi:TatA/E family protein of Tat protein translocase